MKRFLSGLIAVLLLALVPAPVYAADNGEFNLVTSPLPINLAGPPGSTLQTEIRVKNGGLRTEHLKVTLMKFSAYGEEGKPAIIERQPGDDYFDWVSFSPQRFEAPSNQWITVKMTVHLPKSAAFGYYYAVVFSRANKPGQPKDKTNVLIGSTAVLVLVEAQVPGAKREAKIIEFKSNKGIYEFLPADFTVKLRNSGNVHLIASGNIFIKRGSKTLATLDVNAARGNVLPKNNRIFTASWNDGWPVYADKQAGGKVVLDKKGQPVKTLQWDFSKMSKLKFGHYSAHLLLAYDNGHRDVPVEAEINFWVIPWRILFFGLIVAGLVGVGLWTTGRNLIKKVRKQK